MWAMQATQPSTTTWPPPGQSNQATCRTPCALAPLPLLIVDPPILDALRGP